MVLRVADQGNHVQSCDRALTTIIFYVQISDPTMIYNNCRTVQPPSTQKSDPSMANRF